MSHCGLHTHVSRHIRIVGRAISSQWRYEWPVCDFDEISELGIADNTKACKLSGE